MLRLWGPSARVASLGMTHGPRLVKDIVMRHLSLGMNESLKTKTRRSRGVIDRYREFLPVSDSTPIVSLGEGGTPLIFSPRLSAIVGRRC